MNVDNWCEKLYICFHKTFIWKYIKWEILVQTQKNYQQIKKLDTFLIGIMGPTNYVYIIYCYCFDDGLTKRSSVLRSYNPYFLAVFMIFSLRIARSFGFWYRFFYMFRSISDNYYFTLLKSILHYCSFITKKLYILT